MARTMITIRVKGVVPQGIERYNGTANQHIYDAWKNQPLEPYGKVIPGYGKDAPHNRECISVRLALPGVAAFTAVALDEIDGLIDLARLPKQPSYMGLARCVGSYDSGLA